MKFSSNILKITKSLGVTNQFYLAIPKNKELYLTVICLWDNKIDNLLCAKYFPIHIGKGEVGMGDDM